MDMKEYMGTSYLGLEDITAPRQEIILDIQLGDFGKPDLYFENGDRLSLNVTNTRVLGRAWGTNSDDWIGKTVQLFIGEVTFKGEPQKSVLVRAISPPARKAEAAAGKRGVDFDDEVPF